MLDGALWLAQFLMFVAFAVAAWMKTMTPISKLAATWPWTGQLPGPVVRGLGLIDLLGGAGVFLPALLDILPQLSVPAALGCVALQLSERGNQRRENARGRLCHGDALAVMLEMAGRIRTGR